MQLSAPNSFSFSSLCRSISAQTSILLLFYIHLLFLPYSDKHSTLFSVSIFTLLLVRFAHFSRLHLMSFSIFQMKFLIFFFSLLLLTIFRPHFSSFIFQLHFLLCTIFRSQFHTNLFSLNIFCCSTFSTDFSTSFYAVSHVQKTISYFILFTYHFLFFDVKLHICHIPFMMLNIFRPQVHIFFISYVFWCSPSCFS